MSNTKDHRRFCINDGWELYKSTDHDFFRKIMLDGTIKYTKVSRGNKQYNKGICRRILKEQLGVTMEEFNEKI